MENLKKQRFDRVRIRLGVVILALSVVVAPLAIGSSVQAAEPLDPPVAAPFDALECAGNVIEDPTNADGPVGNLLSVFGARLDAYNSGTVVPLYDSFGGNEVLYPVGGGYPPVCGVRYDPASGGPVSEWMFCTDYFSYVCSGVNENGDLVDKLGAVLPPMSDVGSNAKLDDPDTERMIVALINGAWPYVGVGSFDSYPGVNTAVADGTSEERINLQVLVWCLTDEVDPATTVQSEIDRAATCAASMDQNMRAALLAAAPDIPTFSLVVQSPASNISVGATATFELNTNILNRPIELTLGGPATGLTVVNGAATLSGTTLTVTGAGPVVLSVTGTGAGEVTLHGATEAVTASHLAWHQSQRTDGERPCQVFSTMFSAPDQLDASAVAMFVAAPTNTTTNEIAATGASVPGITLGSAGLLLVLGTGILVSQYKRRVS